MHHIELWVPDIHRAKQEWGWILRRLGYSVYQSWDVGINWCLDHTYIVAEQSPALSGRNHERTLPGLNHLTFRAGSPNEVDGLAEEASRHGWMPSFEDRYPHAGGPDRHAAYLVNSDGFEIELVAVNQGDEGRPLIPNAATLSPIGNGIRSGRVDP